MRFLLGLSLLFAVPALAAKPVVLVDAQKPLKTLLEKALSKKHTTKGVVLSGEPSNNEVKSACRDGQAIGVVTGRIEDGVVTVQVLNGADGGLLTNVRFKAPPKKKPLKALPKGTDKRLLDALKKASAPKAESTKLPEPPVETPEEPEPVAKTEPKSEPKVEPRRETRETRREEPETRVEKRPEPEEVEDEDTAAQRPVALRATAGIRLFSRRLFWVDNIFAQLSKYRLGLGPAIAIDAEWFPGAHFAKKGVLPHIGLQFAVDFAVGISSLGPDGTRYGTSALRLRTGLVGRIPLGALELRPHLGLGLQNFAIAQGAMGAAKPNIPDVNYTTLRFGLGTRINVASSFALLGGFAYQAPLSTGEMGKFFPRLSVGGLDTHVGFALTFGKLEIRLVGDYTRYWYSLKPEPGDAYVAGGALDDGFGITATAGIAL